MKRSLSALAIFAALFANPVTSRGEVTFVVTYEPGSKWLTQSYSAQARANFQQRLNEIGALIEHAATIEVYATDDEASAYARTSWNTTRSVTLPSKLGTYDVPGVWYEIKTGVDPNGSAYDCTVHWNFDLYGSDTALLNNIAGLTRHEIMHPLGMSGQLYHDSRGTSSRASVMDAMLVDYNGSSLLGGYNSGTGKFAVNNYVLDPGMAGGSNRSGLRFQAIRADGSIQLLELSAGSTTIDFSHLAIAYAGGRSWSDIVEEDLNFLRGLGYQMKNDPPTLANGQTLSDYYYGQANFYHAYFSRIGDQKSALAFWFYFRAYGHQALRNSQGSSALANKEFYLYLAYFYYTYLTGSSANYYYYLYLGYSDYTYYLALGNSANAGAYFNFYYALALSFL